MAVEVVTPEDYLGDVIGDLASRQGHAKEWTRGRTTRLFVQKCRWPNVRLCDGRAQPHAG